jgi:cysteine desulfurase/selenocysteine lyase
MPTVPIYPFSSLQTPPSAGGFGASTSAAQYDKVLPSIGTNPLGTTVLPDGNYDFLIGQSALAPLATPTVPTNPLSSLQTPPSSGGFGASPSVLQYGNVLGGNGFDTPQLSQDQLQTNQFQKNNAASFGQFGFLDGKIPAAVSGSGASPSAIQHGNNTDIANPQTSFPDKNLKDGGIPQSVAGSGASPLALSLDKNYAPLQQDPFFGDLQAILNPLNSKGEKNSLSSWDIDFSHQPQLPNSPTGISDAGASYYFLSSNPFVPSKLPPPVYVKTNDGNKIALRDLGNLAKNDFPILKETVNGKQLVWLDNAATTQKPQSVIDRLSYFYEHENSNIHRAAHELAARATDAYEKAREKCRQFINAKSPNEIIFVRGTTEAINLVAKSYGEQFLSAGDEIIISHLEHHANIVPWQQLAAKKGLKIKVIPVNDDGELLLDEYVKLLGPKVKLVSFTQVSNALGTVTPAKQIVEMAHSVGAKVLVDGAQSVSHLRSDVQYLNADWFVFSGHKVFGPTGIGVLYGKEDLLNETDPWQGGGNMIKDVTFEHTQYHDAPNRFEAGTGNIADAVGLGAAIDYVNKIGIDLINQYEHALLLYGTQLLKDVPGLRLIGTAHEKASVMSFTLQGYSNDEVGKALNKEGMAVRTGHHCAQPILRRMGVETTVRPSLAFYNTCGDVDRLVSVLWNLKGGKK